MKTLGEKLKGFGGILKCETCGKTLPLMDIGYKLTNGWPECCGYTMRWITQKEQEAYDYLGEEYIEYVIKPLLKNDMSKLQIMY